MDPRKVPALIAETCGDEATSFKERTEQLLEVLRYWATTLSWPTSNTLA
jgi:hypothetical protein